MLEESDKLLDPEEALTRFQRPDMSQLDLVLTENKSSHVQYGFRLGNIGILISDGTMSEVIKNYSVYPVPNTKSWLQGLINLRGNLVPVYDLNEMLGLADKPMEYGNILVLDKGAESVGILIESLPKVCDVDSWSKLRHIPKLPSGVSEFVSHVYSVDNTVWMRLNHKEFFNSVKDKVAI